MLKVRQLLTEVLITVTTEEITAVAQEVYNREKAKAAKGTHKHRTFQSIVQINCHRTAETSAKYHCMRHLSVLEAVVFNKVLISSVRDKTLIIHNVLFQCECYKDVLYVCSYLNVACS